MNLVEHLTRIHRETPGCRSVIFGDVRTRTVLRASADEDFRQEDHDRCLSEAAICLGPACTDLFAMVFGDGAEPPTGAVLRNARRTSHYVLLDAERSDVVAATTENGLPPTAMERALLLLAQADD